MSEVETPNAVVHEENAVKCDEKVAKPDGNATKADESDVKMNEENGNTEDEVMEKENEEEKEEIAQAEKHEKTVDDSLIADSSINAEKSEDASGGDDEDSDSDSEESLPPGLLERPVEILEAKRERKKITRFSYDDEKPSPTVEKKKQLEVPKGSGTRLGDQPRIEYQLQRNTAEDLRIIHRFFYGFPGNNISCKKNIREFRGFDMKKDTPEYEKKEEVIGKFTVDNLKWAMNVCDVPITKGIKDDLIDAFMEWCLCPKPQDKPVPVKRRRKDSEQKKKKKTKKAGTKRKSKSIENGEATSDGVTPVKKPRKKIDTKSKKKTQTKTAKIKITSPKSKPKMDSSMDDSSDEEPLLQKRKSAPTNPEIRKFVENMLKDADLEVLTMKVVFTQVYEQYPEFDLSDRKSFIKETVKKLIS